MVQEDEGGIPAIGFSERGALISSTHGDLDKSSVSGMVRNCLGWGRLKLSEERTWRQRGFFWRDFPRRRADK